MARAALSMRLEGRTALVTGAASGNGRAIALRFAEEGANIVVADVAEASARETACQIEALGRRALVTRTDVSQRGEVEAMLSQALETFGQVDVLVNNAGVETLISFLKLPEEEWDRVLSINLKGPYLCGQVIARHMVSRGIQGSIVNIASINSEVAFKGQAHYAASKGGVRMLTKAMAIDLAPHGIRVNAVAPGVIDTAMTARSLATAEVREWMMANIPLNRIGQPRDVANVALFLASSEASYMTGSIVFVDGGWLIQ
jgi:NAD(P)-dependent dehydrogenase (short-subunit alcohol dehydrogenase family)